MDAYAIAQWEYYFGLADRRAKSRKYARKWAGGLDSPRRVIHGRKVLDEQYRVPSECVTMGLINKLLSNLFVGKNIVK